MSNNQIILCMGEKQLGHSTNTQLKFIRRLFAILNLVENRICIARSLVIRVFVHKSIWQIKCPVSKLLHQRIVTTLSMFIASKSLVL